MQKHILIVLNNKQKLTQDKQFTLILKYSLFYKNETLTYFTKKR